MRSSTIALLALALLPAIPAQATNLTFIVEATPITPPPTATSPLHHPTPGVRLISQGTASTQSDLSIRGSPFNSTGLLLQGLPLRNPQTEHFHADLPLPAQWFTPPTALTGLDNFRRSHGHPSGSLALELTPTPLNALSLRTNTDSKGLLHSALNGTIHLNPNPSSPGSPGYPSYPTISASAATTYTRASQTDGYSNNYLDQLAAATRLSALSSTLQADLITSLAWREFGARGFYGASPAYPAAERVTSSLLYASLKGLDTSSAPDHLSLAWQRNRDQYWLDRHQRHLFSNHHTTDFLALHANHRYQYSPLLSLDLRTDYDWEFIHSDSLGNHNRGHTSLALIPNLHLDPLTLTLGGALELFTHESPRYLPAAGIEWHLTDYQRLFLSLSTAVRQPSYTELNYSAPDSLGNAGLSMQRVECYELGWQLEHNTTTIQTTLFHEQGRNTVDWIRANRHARWVATNIRRIRTWGLSLNTTTELTSSTLLYLDATALTKSHSGTLHASRYALDYPEYHLTAAIQQSLTDQFKLRLDQTLAWHHSNPARHHNSQLTHTTPSIAWHPTRYPWLTLALGIDNLFDDNFQHLPGQPPLGRRYFATLNLSF